MFTSFTLLPETIKQMRGRTGLGYSCSSLRLDFYDIKYILSVLLHCPPQSKGTKSWVFLLSTRFQIRTVDTKWCCSLWPLPIPQAADVQQVNTPAWIRQSCTVQERCIQSRSRNALGIGAFSSLPDIASLSKKSVFQIPELVLTWLCASHSITLKFWTTTQIKKELSFKQSS